MSDTSTNAQAEEAPKVEYPPPESPVAEKLVPAPTITIPDGGLQAWLSVLGGFLVCTTTFGYSNSFGVYQDYYVLSGASSSSNISWIGSIQLFFMFAMGLPAGKLFDQGYFHHVLGFGSLLYVFCMFMLSLAHPQKYYQLVLSQGIGMGIGSGLMLVPAMSVQAHHWRTRRSLAMGIVMMGSGIGGLIYPIMLNRLVHGSAGFAWGVRATAFLTLGLLVIANAVMTTRLPSAKKRGPGPKPDMKAIMTDVPFLVLVFGLFLVLWGMFFPYFYLQLWVNLHGLSSTLAFYTIAILNAASIFGRTLPNMLADRIGPFNVLVPVAAITAALVLAMFGVKSTGAVVVFSILYGFFSGATIALMPPAVATLSNSVHEIGMRLGLAYFFTSLAMLTGTPIAGALYDEAGQWYKPIVFSAVSTVVQLVSVIARSSPSLAHAGSSFFSRLAT
ncbi:major facilitator superfamily domain-containing protein [Fomitopsis serialis]|uniref:major facilitator superfamily domain-containing protein n=1 Tax=Fomitopsis serialis TaxID=139415 RepID=UPI0020085CB5|nr:major facilitator superfamily domain-containing protein [Neoantrodia serialis]KAH9934401.1 major facilitator superfamily domain-containing protein [Neoantrodia serialis]